VLKAKADAAFEQNDIKFVLDYLKIADDTNANIDSTTNL
jgi:hypothetical protein